ncbi:hypothetical protein HXX76_003360 [Chlamydomonas incerta]|uniref:Uncharacterized protein n=1 Tax=Chlamydomonas incerta TaxID=51695 RepID=A0A835W6Y6_CHLIN|nr:hypothetical protein HXX76_003360 [Chlamydomonas incerta]|eukprot:KAG2441745.1 hypothetical protein HXX76_003360 [Chlamydomonas incerta]
MHFCDCANRAPVAGASSAAVKEEASPGAHRCHHHHHRNPPHHHHHHHARAGSSTGDLLGWDEDDGDEDVSYEEEEGFGALDLEDEEEDEQPAADERRPVEQPRVAGARASGSDASCADEGGGHSGSGNKETWTILDDGELVDPADVIVLASDRSAFGSLQGSVIEVAPFDFKNSNAGTGGAAGSPDSDMLVRLAAILVRFMAVRRTTPPPQPQHNPWQPHGSAVAEPPAALSTVSVESELQQLGLCGVRFGEAVSQTNATTPGPGAMTAATAAAAALGAAAGSSGSVAWRAPVALATTAAGAAEGHGKRASVGAAAQQQQQQPKLLAMDMGQGVTWALPHLTMLELGDLDSSSEGEGGDDSEEEELQMLGWQKLERRQRHAAGLAGSLAALVPGGGGIGASAACSRPPPSPTISFVRGQNQQLQQQCHQQVQQPRAAHADSRSPVRGPKARMSGRSVSQLPPLIEEEEHSCEVAGGTVCAPAATEGGARSPPSSPAVPTSRVSGSPTTSTSMPLDGGVSRSGSKELQWGSRLPICTLDIIACAGGTGAAGEATAASSCNGSTGSSTTAAAKTFTRRSRSFGAIDLRVQAPCLFLRRHRRAVEATTASADNSPLPSSASLCSAPLTPRDACGSVTSSCDSESDSSGEGKAGSSSLAGRLRRLVSALQQSFSGGGSGPSAHVEAAREAKASNVAHALGGPILSSCSLNSDGTSCTSSSSAQPSNTAAQENPLSPQLSPQPSQPAVEQSTVAMLARQLHAGMGASSQPAVVTDSNMACRTDTAFAKPQRRTVLGMVVRKTGNADQGLPHPADVRSSPSGFFLSAALTGDLRLRAGARASSSKQSAVAHLDRAAVNTKEGETADGEGPQPQPLAEAEAEEDLLQQEPASPFIFGRIASLFRHMPPPSSLASSAASSGAEQPHVAVAVDTSAAGAHSTVAGCPLYASARVPAA